MSLLEALKIGSSALTAQRLRMDVVTNNIANMETTRTAEGGPYRAAHVVFAPLAERSASGMQAASFADRLQGAAGGLQVVDIVEDNTPPKQVYNPRHPDANAEGYVSYPNVDLVSEMTDLMSATRAYEASVTALNSVKQMAGKALEIGRG
ncbi:MAG: flagellar basal body rod protein FlgC [Chloroflexota bacterium]